MRSALLVGFLLLVSGCVGGSSTSKPVTNGTDGIPAPDNTTLEGVLLGSPHLKVVSTTTLQWNVENGTPDSPKFAATLVKFTDAFKASFVNFSGDIKLVAAIPVEGLGIGAACAAPPPSIRSYFQPRDTGQRGVQNLTATYGPGWYHFVIVSTGDGSFGISFDAKKEAKPRTLPAKDPYVTGGFATVAGSRDPAYTIDSAGRTWFAIASTSIGNNALDGQREITASVGDCQTGKTSGSGNNNRVASAAAAGLPGSVNVKGSYKPTLAPLAPPSATLAVGWVSIREPEVKAPG